MTYDLYVTKSGSALYSIKMEVKNNKTKIISAKRYVRRTHGDGTLSQFGYWAKTNVKLVAKVLGFNSL